MDVKQGPFGFITRYMGADFCCNLLKNAGLNEITFSCDDVTVFSTTKQTDPIIKVYVIFFIQF